jgi:hypothetical protein
MKKLILILLLAVPILAMGQRRTAMMDTAVTITTDTIIKLKVITSKNWSWHFDVSELAGTLDATVELVVADAFSTKKTYNALTAPADAYFIRYSDNMIRTLSSNTIYSFYKNDLNYEFIGLEITMNNCTSMVLDWVYLKAQKQ